MNAKRRKEIDKAIGLIEEAKAILETARNEEQEYYDNMPENLQSSEKGENASADADKLSEWVDALGEMDANELDH